MSTRVILAAFALGGWCASIAHADNAGDASDTTVERARLHYQAGEKLYLLGRYPDALREFRDGYALEPRPEFLINLGQVHRKLGNRAAAVAMFEQFLAGTTTDDPRRLAVHDILRDLRAEIDAEPAAREPSLSAQPVAARRAGPDGADAAAAHHRWYRDWVGGTLTSAGLLGAGVGTGLFVSANADIGDAQIDLDRYFDARDASTTRTVGLVVLGAGTALVIGGIVRYITHDR